MKNLENRTLTSEFEVRNEEGKPIIVEGYAARFDEETVIGGAFVEKVSRSAFEGTDMSNTVALFNHDMNMPLARMGHGLELEVDEQGLKYRFELGEQSYAKDLAENIRMGIVSTSSFGFTVKEDSWEQRDGQNVRTLEAIDILFDVSPTTQGAYPTTEVGLRSMELAFANEEVAAIEAEVATEEIEETEVREEEVTAEVAAEEQTEEPTPEVVEEDEVATEEETNEEAPASEEEEEQPEAEVEEDETEAEEEITPESEESPAEEEEDSTVRATEISDIMENTNNAPAVVQSLGDKNVAKRFDLTKAIKEVASGRALTGVEAEAFQAAQDEARSNNMFIEGQIAMPSEWRADAAPMTAGAAGVQTSEGIFEDGQDFVRNFRPSTVAEKLGATMFRNASGPVVIPVQNANITAAELNELADLDRTNVGFSNVTINPQRIGAGTSFSKQLLAQTSADLESFIMGDLKREMDLKADKYVVDVLEAGITYVNDTAGAYSDLSGTPTAPDFAELASLMEMDLRTGNVDLANAKFLLDPAALRNFKRASLDAGSGQFAGVGANIYGYGFETTNQTTAGKIVLGDFRDLVIVEWGGLDLIVDPYSGKDTHSIEIAANMHIGAAVRRAGAFKGVQVA